MNAGEAPKQSSDARPNRDWSLHPRFATFGPFQLDFHRRELFKNGKRLRLQGKVAETLFVLIEKPGEVVTREALRCRLWPGEIHVDYDANVNTTINKLRRLLGETADQAPFIETIPREGYAFVGKLDYLDQLPIQHSEQTIPEIDHSGRFTPLVYEKSRLPSFRASTWFMIGIISLVISAILFGAALALYIATANGPQRKISATSRAVVISTDVSPIY